MRLRRRFLWSPFSVVVGLASERGRFEPAVVAGVVDMIEVAERIEDKQEVQCGGTYNLFPLSAATGPTEKVSSGGSSLKTLAHHMIHGQTAQF